MKKLFNKKGFTLMEMLIVVAIIVILVAVSVPTFTGSLNEAKEATDAANLRAAKAVAINAYMLGEEGDIANDMIYDLENSQFSSDCVAAYSEATSGKVIKAVVDTDGVDVEWADCTCSD